VFVLPPGKDQSASLFGPPIKTESPKKQKQPSTISSKEKVSKQTLNFSGDKKPSSSLKDISASLKSLAKQKLDKDHVAASTSSSSSATSKEKVQQIQSSKEKHSSKDSNSSSKMVPNTSHLLSQQKPSDSPIPSEKNQKGPEDLLCLLRLSGKAKKDKVVKHKSCENKDLPQSESKDGKDGEKKESNSKDDKILKFDDKREAKDDKKGPRDDKHERKDEVNKLKKVVADDNKDDKDDKK
ncbi:hypothetical protein CHS0354_009864, partial [Potamilus streckersoni]